MDRPAGQLCEAIANAIDEAKDDLCASQPTRRERIATKVLAGMIPPIPGPADTEFQRVVCDAAVSWADALIERLDREEA